MEDLHKDGEEVLNLADEGTSSENEHTLDYSDDPSSEEDSATFDTKPYDPRPQEDEARRNIAYLLIGLLWFLVVAMIGLMASDVIKPEAIKDFSVVLGPIVTLVSAATGFYYGTKTGPKSGT